VPLVVTGLLATLNALGIDKPTLVTVPPPATISLNIAKVSLVGLSGKLNTTGVSSIVDVIDATPPNVFVISIVSCLIVILSPKPFSTVIPFVVVAPISVTCCRLGTFALKIQVPVAATVHS